MKDSALLITQVGEVIEKFKSHVQLQMLHVNADVQVGYLIGSKHISIVSANFHIFV